MKKNILKNKKMVLVIIAVLIGGCMLPFIDTLSDSSILNIVGASRIDNTQRNVFQNLHTINLFSSNEEKRNPSPIGDRDSNDSWMNPNWKYRKEITINHSKVDADLSNFPVLVSISSDSDLSDSSKCQVDGDDILFTDVNREQLSHEIEFFDDSTGELVAWVNVSSLSSSVNTTLYMYYGNSGCGNQQDVSGVWDSTYMIVQHLNETSGTHFDSTSNGNDGTNYGSTQDYTGMVDGANSYDGSSDYVDCGNDDSLDITAEVTIEAWVYKTGSGTGTYPGIISRAGTSGTKRYQFRYKPSESNVQFFLGDGATYDTAVSNADLPTSSWTHLVGTWDGTNLYLFVNGVQQTDVGDFSGSPSFTTEPFEIGRYTASNYFAGGIDEVRASNIFRNSSWILTEYNNQYDPTSFFVLGSEEKYQPPGEPIASNESPMNNSKGVPIGVNALSVSVNDPQGDDMDVYFRTNASGSWADINVNSSVPNGTYSQEYTFDNYGSTYWWSVNVTDPLGSGNWTNSTFVFITEIGPVTNPFAQGWKYIKEITINHDKVDCDLVNFPVYINITDMDLSNKANDDGDDIIFMDDEGVANKLNHEIEYYDSADGNLIAWVNVTSISSVSDTSFYMYYGNPLAGNMENVSGVWDSNYMIIQHLSETSGIHYDSTSNGNDGSPQGSVNQNLAGQIDGADGFDGTVSDNDWVNCGGDSSLDINDAITIEAWVNRTADGFGNFPGIICRNSTGYNRYQLRYRPSSTAVQFFLGDTTTYDFVGSDSDLPLDTWTHVVGTWDGSTMLLFVDGVQQTDTGTFTSLPVFSSEVLEIGRYTVQNYFKGGIDEVKISNINREACWIATEYNNQFDPDSFYTVGSEEGIPENPIISNESPEIGSVNIPLEPILSIQAFDYQGDDMDIYFRTNASGIWENISSNLTVSNGIYFCSNTIDMNNYSTTYWWSVNVTDPLGSGNWTNNTFMFFTEIGPVTNPFAQGWMYQKKITIDHDKVDCDLVNFPVYINLIDTDLRDKANESGYDIIFMDDEGVANKLNHEIEYYDSADGNLIAWVNVTSVSSVSDTSFYMYYGNPLADDMENSVGVWDSDYMIVQHLNEVSGIHYDSTSNGNNGTNYGSIQDFDGQIDGANSFDGSNDWIDCGNDSSLNIDNALTIEAWVNKTGNGLGTYPGIISRASGTKRYQFRYKPDDSEVQFFLGDGSSYDYVSSNADLPSNTWTHVVGTWDGSTMLLFVDGVQQTDTGDFSGSPSFSDEILEIGRYTSQNCFAGVIDEVKISNIVRSSCWISTEYNNQIEPNSFYSIGSEEGIPQNPILSNESPENGAVGISLEPVLSIQAIDYQGDDMEIYFKTNASGIWTTIGSNISVSDGIYYCGNTVDMNNYSTKYWWSVNATDPSGSDSWNNKTYSFTTRPENYYHLFSIDSASHKNYGCAYPVTYIFDIPADMENLKVYKFDSCDWILIPNKTRDEIQNGIEAARFNYTENKAYISVAFPNSCDSFIIDIVDENNESINASFNDIATYYDDKEMAVTVTCDDWYERYHDYFMTAIDECQVRNIWISPGIVTHGSAVYQEQAGRILPPDWDDMQQQIDEGFLEPTSHSRNHIHLSYDEEQWGVQSSYDGEILGSRQDIFENITMPPLNRRGNDEHLYAWIEPYGESDSTVRQKIGQYYYLSDRSTGTNSQYATWDSTNNVYNRIGTVLSLDSVRDYDTLNDYFNTTYSSNGVYHIWGHARDHNWISGDVADHFDYISNRSDVWYVGFGHLYMYHYMEERNVISHSTDVSNLPIGISLESPANNSIGVGIGSKTLQIRAVNINNASMDIAFRTNESGSWQDIGTNISVFNGFYQQTYTFPNYDTSYWWSVNCTYGTVWTNKTYTFITRPENYIPIISNPIPYNGASDISMGNVSLSITVSDQDGELMDITFRTNASGSWTDIGTNSSSPNGTYSQIYNFSEPIYLYYWSVNCTDGKIWVNKTYTFTTERMTYMDPYSNGWQYRKKIEIDHDEVDCDLTNFPVLIDIFDIDIATNAQSDRDDIIFMDGDGVANLLSHEIEYFDLNGNLTVWVNVTSLSSTVNTTIYMYYGNPYIPNMEDISGVWDSNFAMVQHLSETSGAHYDSTIYGNDGTCFNGTDQNAVGVIDGSDTFDGADDWISCGNSETFDITESITLEAWVNRSGDGFGNYPSIITRAGIPNNRYQLRYKPADNVGQFFLGDDAGYTIISTDGDLVSNEWMHLVATWDGTNMKLFVNGVEQADTNTFTRLPSLAYQTLEIGRYTEINYFSGGIDEVRISDVNRSACWISTEFNNQENPDLFYIIGEEETESILEEYIVSLNPEWNKISLPFNKSFDKKDIIVSYSGTNYSWSDAVNNTIVLNFIYEWNRKEQSYELVTSLKPGHGYWVWAYDSCDLLFMVNVTPDDLITSLNQSWNVIGLPFNTPIAKEDLIINYNGTDYSWYEATTNNNEEGEPLILGFIYKWNSSTQSYILSDDIDPTFGYWMYAYYQCILKR